MTKTTKNALGQSEYLALLEAVTARCPLPDEVSLRYVEYGQWEMNFEALLISLMRVDQRGLQFRLSDFEVLAKEAGLTEEGVLDPDTWRKFVAWMNEANDH